MIRSRYLLACVAAVMAVSVLADDASKASDAAKADALTHVVDPYNAADQKAKFDKLSGKTGELDAKTFEADRKAGDNLIMPFEKWETAVLFDKDKNSTLDWFEFDAYRQAMRKAVLAACDEDKDGKLTGDERTAALKRLAEGQLTIKPDAERATGLPPGFGAVVDTGPTSAPAKRDEVARAAMIDKFISPMDEVATLSDEQKQNIRELLDAYMEETGKYRAETERLFGPVMDARRSGDADKAAAAKEAFDAENAAWNEFKRTQQARLMALLTAKQRVAWREAQWVKMAGVCFPVEFDDGQVRKLKAAFADSMKDEPFFDQYEPTMYAGPDRIGHYFEANEYMKWILVATQPVLTEEQRKQVDKSRDAAGVTIGTSSSVGPLKMT